MASAVVPITKIRIDSTLSTTVSRSSALSSPVRKVLRWWLFPRVLQFVLTELWGRLGQLTPEQAGELYGPLRQFHFEINEVLARREHKSYLARLISAGWSDRVREQSDRLGDLVESLAWGSDPQLREYIDEAVDELVRIG